MGCCFSTSAHTPRSPTLPPLPGPPPPPPTRHVSQKPQSQAESIELREGFSQPVPPPHDVSLMSAKQVQPNELIAAPIPPQPDGRTSPNPPPRSGRSKFAPVSRGVSRTTSASPYNGARLGVWPVSEGESSWNPFPEPDGPNPSSSSHPMSRSFSMDTSLNSARNGTRHKATGAPLSSIKGGGHSDRSRSVTVPDPGADPRAATKRAATRGNITRSLLPVVREVLHDGFRFRVLVLGKRQSGKSSLINAVFNVDMAAVPGSQHGNADINVGFHPDNNRYLVVHEYSGFESEDAESLKTIRDFISYRTDTNCSVSERLHAIWICVPMSDAVMGELGEGVKKILGTKNVPVLIVFTKFDLLVSRVQFDIAREDIQKHEDPGARASVIYENLCRSQFRKDPKDVPAVIFSEKRAYGRLIDELTSITHGFFKSDSPKSTGRATSSQPMVPQIAPALLAWSAAQRVNHDINIQASIEIGRSRYWRSLGSSQDFTDQVLGSCVNVIHEDIINVWNFDDRERYLLGREFRSMMTDLVGDMAGTSHVSPRLYLDWNFTAMAPWTNGSYQNNHKNIRCIMAYIVDLTVILHGLFLTTRSVSATKAQSAVEDYAKSSSRNQVHEDIGGFVAQTPLTYQNKDIMMEKIIDLIKQNCVQTSS